MVDSETNTYWSHLLGRGMEGPLKDQELTMMASVVCDWNSWKREHPETTVLDMLPTIQSSKNDFYQDPKAYVIGVVSPEQSRAWELHHLMNQTIINDEFNGPVVAVHDAGGAGTRVFSSVVDNETLSFVMNNGAMQDLQTGSTWNPRTGVAIHGDLAGKKLVHLKAKISLKKAWDVFYPECNYWFPVDVK